MLKKRNFLEVTTHSDMATNEVIKIISTLKDIDVVVESELTPFNISNYLIKNGITKTLNPSKGYFVGKPNDLPEDIIINFQEFLDNIIKGRIFIIVDNYFFPKNVSDEYESLVLKILGKYLKNFTKMVFNSSCYL
jgi:hypothetical protein